MICSDLILRFDKLSTNEADIRKLFKTIDPDDDGVLSMFEFETCATDIGERSSPRVTFFDASSRWIWTHASATV